jgi:hypothetical protein
VVTALKLGVDVFTTGQVGKMLGAAPRTVSCWIDSGKLAGHRLPCRSGGDFRRVRRADLVRFARERGLPLPPGFAPGRAAGVWLPPAWAAACGLEAAASPFAVAADAAGGLVGAAVVGTGHGLSAALDLARFLAARAPHCRRALVVGPDRDAGAVPPAFDAGFTEDCDPALVRAWLEAGGTR